MNIIYVAYVAIYSFSEDTLTSCGSSQSRLSSLWTNLCG